MLVLRSVVTEASHSNGLCQLFDSRIDEYETGIPNFYMSTFTDDIYRVILLFNSTANDDTFYSEYLCLSAYLYLCRSHSCAVSSWVLQVLFLHRVVVASLSSPLLSEWRRYCDGWCLSCCVCVRLISLGGEGNALCLVLSGSSLLRSYNICVGAIGISRRL